MHGRLVFRGDLLDVLFLHLSETAWIREVYSKLWGVNGIQYDSRCRVLELRGRFICSESFTVLWPYMLPAKTILWTPFDLAEDPLVIGLGTRLLLRRVRSRYLRGSWHW